MTQPPTPHPSVPAPPASGHTTTATSPATSVDTATGTDLNGGIELTLNFDGPADVQASLLAENG